MSKLFDFLKSASKAIDNVEDVVGKVSKFAEDMTSGQAQVPAAEPLKKYSQLLEEYGSVPGGAGKQHEFDAFLFEPMFHVTYTLPDAESYIEEGDFGAGEIYEGYSYQNDETATMLFSIGEVNDDISREKVLNTYSRFNSPLTMLDYQTAPNPKFDIRAELANEEIHQILYIRGLTAGNTFFADCTVHTKKVSPKTAVKIMKDFEDMVAGMQYSDELTGDYD